MEISERFGFNLPSRDGDDLADINQISDNFRIIENVVPYVDGKFDPKSQNAQNGEAVSEAVKMVGNPILKYLTYEVKENNTVNIVSCDKTIYGKHIIPEFIDGYPVTSIGANFIPGMAWAFYGCENLTEIVIPDSVEVVGANAFSACINLNGVMFGRGVKTIKASAFSECSSLNFVKMHNVIETIEIGAFEECGALSDVYYSGSAEEWGNISVGRSNDYLLQANIHFNYDPTLTTKGYVDEALRNAVDQTFDPTSPNAQSGKAVAEAVSGKEDKKQWTLLKEIAVEEVVNRIIGGAFDKPYKELWVEAEITFETDYTSAKTGLFSLGAKSLGTTHTEYWSSISNGSKERLKAHCYVSPSGSLETTTFHSTSYYVANTPKTTAFLNRYDWRSGFDQITLTLSEESGGLGLHFGVGTKLKVWGR